MGVIDVDVGSAIGGFFNGLDSLFTSDEERKAAALVKAKLLQEPHRWQAMINLAEAQHPSNYKGGWRPAIGYICAAALGWTFVIQPIAAWCLAVFRPDIAPPPALVTDMLFELVIGMLGLAGLRTYEKRQGVER